jgi:hypothetical protein
MCTRFEMDRSKVVIPPAFFLLDDGKEWASYVRMSEPGMRQVSDRSMNLRLLLRSQGAVVVPSQSELRQSYYSDFRKSLLGLLSLWIPSHLGYGTSNMHVSFVSCNTAKEVECTQTCAQV